MFRGGEPRRLGLVLAVAGATAALTLGVPLSALASGGGFSTSPKSIPNVPDNGPVSLGAWISVGFNIENHNANPKAVTLYLSNTAAVINLTCSPKGALAGHLNVPLPKGPYTIPANDKNWWPVDKQNDPRTYWFAFQFSSQLSPCSGGTAYVVPNGEIYSGTLQSSNDTTDPFHIQLHTAIPDAANRGNVNCFTASQPSSACDFGWNGSADNLVPSAYVAPTTSPSPTPAPTPSPSSSPSANPTPAPTSSPGPSGSQPPGTADPGSGSAPSGSGSAAGTSLSGVPFAPTTALGAHGSRIIGGGTLGITSGAGVSRPTLTGPSSPNSSADALQPVPVASVPPTSAPLLPITVLSPAGVATGSLVAHLPVQWYALLAAVDCVLILAIIARRNRARRTTMQSRVSQ